jgi:hypothetical protein
MIEGNTKGDKEDALAGELNLQDLVTRMMYNGFSVKIGESGHLHEKRLSVY